MYKEVVLGGDVWDLLDELMIYMGNPMQYYERGVQFVRVIFYFFFLLVAVDRRGRTCRASECNMIKFIWVTGCSTIWTSRNGKNTFCKDTCKGKWTAVRVCFWC